MMPVYSCSSFDDYEVLLLHDKYGRNEAQNAIDNFTKCQRGINMKCQIRVVQFDDFRGQNFQQRLTDELSNIK